jgi:hypothetical protein
MSPRQQLALIAQSKVRMAQARRAGQPAPLEPVQPAPELGVVPTMSELAQWQEEMRQARSMSETKTNQ